MAKSKRIEDYFQQVDLIKTADDKAIATGEVYKLVAAQRAEHDTVGDDFQAKVIAVAQLDAAYDLKVKEKQAFDKAAEDSCRKLKLWVDAAYRAESERINETLLLDLKYPADDEKAKVYLSQVLDALKNYDDQGGTYPLDQTFVNTLTTDANGFLTTLVECVDMLEDRQSKIQDRDDAMQTYSEITEDIRFWLYKMLPFKRDDKTLKDYGFTPYGTHHADLHTPKNFEYNEETKMFTWDTVEKAEGYEVDFRLHDTSGKWTTMYEGADNHTADKPPDPGEYDFRVRAVAGDKQGNWSGVIVVNFSGGALAAPTNFKFDDKKQIFSWDKVKDADRYQLEYSRDGGQTWTNKYDGAEPRFDARHMDSGKWLFRVRALNATETSPWGITLEVWLGMPTIPKNLRWHPEEYHGDMFAKIEWDAAAGADEYELENITEGFVFNTGSSTFKFEDIMDLPGEHEYRVRAGNAYGWSDWSPVLTFWLGVPAIPLNIGWRFVEHLGEQWWEIYWDSAAGAVNYDLSYINAGHQDYYGPNTRSGPIDPKPEPGEHRFKVRAENGFGFGEWSEILTIVVE